MPFGKNVCQPVGVFCSIDAVLNQIQRFDETSRTENIAQRPVAPWHTTIRVGVICRAGPLVMPTKPTERLVAAGTGRELPQRTSASSSKTKAKTVTAYLCRLAMTPNEKVERNADSGVRQTRGRNRRFRSNAVFVCALHSDSLLSQNRTKPAVALRRNEARFRFNAG